MATPLGPGLSVHAVGGHSAGLQFVRVKTGRLPAWHPAARIILRGTEIDHIISSPGSRRESAPSASFGADKTVEGAVSGVFGRRNAAMRDLHFRIPCWREKRENENMGRGDDNRS
jgi:hypothetical protein